MSSKNIPVVERSLFSWVSSGRLRYHVLLGICALVAVFARLVPLEMQKRIVNEVVQRQKMELLLIYCAIYLFAVLTAIASKYALNMLQVLIAQDTVADMRNKMYAHLLRLPLSFLKKHSSGPALNSLIKELATAGDFIGMAVAMPMVNFLMLFVFTIYLLWLNPLLAVVTMSIYPLMLAIVPRLQKQVNKANRKRLDITRTLSGKIGESLGGVMEIQNNGAFEVEYLKFSQIVHKLKKIRIKWNLFKWGVKASNNFLTSVSRFLVFSVGGYLAVQGRLELGALVAFVSAQEKLYEPWKELVVFYQAYQNAAVNYRRSMDTFNYPRQHRIESRPGTAGMLEGDVEINGLTLEAGNGAVLLRNVDLQIAAGEHLALVGPSGCGKSTLVQCLTRLHRYVNGSVKIGGQEISSIENRDFFNSVSTVAQHPYVFDGTIDENILYGIESLNCWLSPQSAVSLPDLSKKITTLKETGLLPDVLNFGLNAQLVDEQHNLKDKIIQVRKRFQNDLSSKHKEMVEQFSWDNFLTYSSLATNLIFGDSADSVDGKLKLSGNDFFVDFLTTHDFFDPLIELGREICIQTIKALQEADDQQSIYERTPVAMEDIEVCRTVAVQFGRPDKKLSTVQQGYLLDTALNFIPGWHDIIKMPMALRQRLVENRQKFREAAEQNGIEKYCFFSPSSYIDCQSVLNNIIYGVLTDSSSAVESAIFASIERALSAEGCRDEMIQVGLRYLVGKEGERLSGGQRRKISIVRALLKKAALYIFDEATSGLDNRSQEQVEKVIHAQLRENICTLISIVHRFDFIRDYDRIAVMDAGTIVETGTYEQLMAKKGHFFKLAQAAG